MTLVRGAAVHDVNISDDLRLQILLHLCFGHVSGNGGNNGLQDIRQHTVGLLLLSVFILSIAALAGHSSGDVALIGIIPAGTTTAVVFLTLLLVGRLGILGSLLGYVGCLLVLRHLRTTSILCALSNLLEHLLNGIGAGLGDTSAALLVLTALTTAGSGLSLLPALTVLVGAGLLTLPLLALACLRALLLVTLIYCVLDVRPHKEKHHIDLGIQLLRVIRVGGKLNGLRDVCQLFGVLIGIERLLIRNENFTKSCELENEACHNRQRLLLVVRIAFQRVKLPLKGRCCHLNTTSDNAAVVVAHTFLVVCVDDAVDEFVSQRLEHLAVFRMLQRLLHLIQFCLVVRFRHPSVECAVLFQFLVCQRIGAEVVESDVGQLMIDDTHNRCES